MREIHKNWKDLAVDCLALLFVFGMIGIALKFLTVLDYPIPLGNGFWFKFPFFPNIGDVIFLVASALFLGVLVMKRRPKTKQNSDQDG